MLDAPALDRVLPFPTALGRRCRWQVAAAALRRLDDHLRRDIRRGEIDRAVRGNIW